MPRARATNDHGYHELEWLGAHGCGEFEWIADMEAGTSSSSNSGHGCQEFNRQAAMDAESLSGHRQGCCDLELNGPWVLQA
ncbi:Copper transporter [Psidium guajava]|nr:Copper transporter [Psidium guajava]